jgi:hypothetical protein
MSASTLPQPTALSQARWADFATIEGLACPDPKWHFRMAVRWPSSVSQTVAVAPEVGAPQRLCWVRREEPLGDIVVDGHLLDREIDAADLLERELTQEGMTVVSSQPVRLKAGATGDAVATWTRGGEEYAGRFFATKWGPRTFIVSLRARRAAYERLAEDFFTTIATFEALDDSLGLFAEHVKEVKGRVPIRWRAAVPDAWLLMPTQEEDGIGSFQALQMSGHDVESVDGRLSFAVASRGVAQLPRAAAHMFLRAVNAHGLELADESFAEEPASPPFFKSWCCVSECWRGDQRGEVRCRVMMNDKVWVVGGVVGPTREDDREVWEQNKRALDVATSTLKLA